MTVDVDAIVAGLNVPPVPDHGREHDLVDDAPPWEPPDEHPPDEHPPADYVPLDPEDQDQSDLLRLAMARRMLPGGAFILDAPAQVKAIWGEDGRVLWAEDEPAMIFGPTGVGKGTVAQQVVLGRLGLRSEVLGFPVAPDERRVLYLACDRPAQAQRSLGRMVGEGERELLDERLRVWKGPLPADLMKNPDLLRLMAAEAGAGTLVVDSLKDVAFKLTDDETGTRTNNAFQACVAEGIQVLVLHHPRKATADNKRPNAIDDVYGSTWFTAGMGSVLCLWGKPGDAVVEMFHLKQPAEQIEPLTVLHDHRAGRSSVEGAIDLLAVVRSSNGLVAEGAARALFRSETPDRNQVEKARRQLERLVAKGLAQGVAEGRNSAGLQLPTRYYAVAREAS